MYRFTFVHNFTGEETEARGGQGPCPGSPRSRGPASHCCVCLPPLVFNLYIPCQGKLLILGRGKGSLYFSGSQFSLL